MHALILLMIVAVTTFTYLVSKGWLLGYFNYLPEVLSIVAAVYVVVVGLQTRFKNVDPIYWLVFAGLAFGIVCGALVNQLSPGTMFAGLRTYLRALPFFLLPAVFLVTERQVRTQLTVLLAVCLVQLPLAWQQRMATIEIERLHRHYTGTGDTTIGTIMNSGMLSIFLIAVACVLTGFYLKRQITARSYLIIVVLVLLPTTLNETKITFVLLPIVMLITFLAGSEPRARLKNTILAVMMTLGFLTIFIPIYDHFITPRWGYGIIDFFMMEGRVESYLFKGIEVGDLERAGRFDGMLVASREIWKDPATLVFGLGVGNASHSALGEQFTGAYYRQFENFPFNSFSYLLIEQGLLGLILVLFLHWVIFRESYRIATRDQGLMGALAVGWTGVSVTIVLSMIYTGPITHMTSAYLYWYFTGLLVAFGRRVQLQEAPLLGTVRHAK